MDGNAEDILSGDQQGPDNEDTEQRKIAGQIKRALLYAAKRKLAEPSKALLWEKIVRTANESAAPVSKRRMAYGWVAAAAILIVGAAVWLFSLMNAATQPDDLERFAKANLASLVHADSVQVVSSTGHAVNIADDARLRYQDSTLLLTTGKGQEQEVALDDRDRYYSLAVPYGRRSEILLADGTKVWLNSGSQLTFPRRFEGDTRSVYLEGEAFFDVANQPAQPFVVHVNDLDINVLGTTFNLSSYADDDFSSVTLLTGAIALQSKAKGEFGVTQMRPGQKATYTRADRKLAFSMASGEEDISWTTRKLTLVSSPMGGVIRRLERIYNAEISYPAARVESHDRFSGSLDLNQSLMDILTFLYEPSEYRFNQEGRRFVVTPK